MLTCRRCSYLSVVVVGGLVLGCNTSSSIERLTPFDTEHVEATLRYLDSPTEGKLHQIADTDASRHLAKHSDRTGYYPAGTSTLEISRDLVGQSTDPDVVIRVRELLAWIEAAPDRQVECQEDAARYLPEGTRFREPLYLTWGYDIGVAMDGSASLNLTHPRFAADPEELWFYCTHEMHHAGLTALQPFPMSVNEIRTGDQMLDFVRYATMLEGMAVHAARDPRKRAGALDRDPDYVALEDPIRMATYEAAYWEIYEHFDSLGDRPLDEHDWNLVERLSDGERLWYRVGAEMAAAIETHLGYEVLRQIPREGPDAFFERYRQVSGAQP